MILYHYTGLMWLPNILSEGLTRGEIPSDPRKVAYNERQAVNLTTNPNADDQLRIWATGTIDKTRIRITVEMPDAELTTFRQMRERYPDMGKSKVLKIMCPIEERKHWFFAPFVGTDRFRAVEIKEGKSYREIKGDELADLANKVHAERDQAFIMRTIERGLSKGNVEFFFRDGVSESWLFDGTDV